MKHNNIICKLRGHQYIRTVDNNLYCIDTCIRCGKMRKIYRNPEEKEKENKMAKKYG